MARAARRPAAGAGDVPNAGAEVAAAAEAPAENGMLAETAGAQAEPEQEPEAELVEPSSDGADPNALEEEWEEDVEPSYLQSKYTLVSVAAKRARQILDGSEPRVATLSEKAVTVALEELSQGKLYFERMREAP